MPFTKNSEEYLIIWSYRRSFR